MPVARINNTIIYQHEIDSFINNNKYLINRNILYQIIYIKAIDLNSINVNNEKFSPLSDFDNTKSNEGDSLYSLHKINSNNNISDSLFKVIKNKHDIKIFLTLESFDYKQLKKLYGYSINNSNKEKVIYVLFDYCCSLCAIGDSLLRKICAELKVNLKYIYYSDFISIEALACDVAKKQHKYWQMHDSIINTTCKNNLDSIMKIANSISIDTSLFKELLFDKKTIEKHEKNKSILAEMKFFSVPTFIYNNTIYNDVESVKLVLQSED